MAYDLSSLKKQLAEVPEWFSKELGSIQTGRATLAFFDGARVESYGTTVPINQLASMTVEDARTVRIAPWAKETMGAIEKAIRDADFGVSVVTDDGGIRAIFPELTTETREKYAKLVGGKLEEARISVRGLREDVWSDIQKQEKAGALSEDEKFAAKEQMEKLVKDVNTKLEEFAERKEKDILGT